MNKYLIGFAGLVLGAALVVGVLAVTETSWFEGSDDEVEVVTPQVEMTDRYQFSYPADFFVDYRTYDAFSIASDQWQGELLHYPTVSVQVYRSAIPASLPLVDWLEAVGDPNPPIGDTAPKSCTEAVSQFPPAVQAQEIYTAGALQQCLFYGMREPEQAEVAGAQAATFNTGAVSSWAHNTLVRDPADPTTAYLISEHMTALMTDQDYTTSGNPEACQMVLDTFEFREAEK